MDKRMLKNWFKSTMQPPYEKRRMSFIEGEPRNAPATSYQNAIDAIVSANNSLQASAGHAMDDSSGGSSLKLAAMAPMGMSEALGSWFASQSFIGYQMAALISQHWLVAKACGMPARDATRNGFDIVSVDGDEIPPETLKTLQRYDKEYRIRWQCEQFCSPRLRG